MFIIPLKKILYSSPFPSHSSQNALLPFPSYLNLIFPKNDDIDNMVALAALVLAYEHHIPIINKLEV